MEMIEKFKICENVIACLDKLNCNSKLAVAISRERALNSYSKLYSKFCFEKFETIHEYPMTFFIRSDFVYLEELNKFIQMASANGLIKKWRVDNQIQRQYGIENTYQKLKLDHFYGCLIIWCIILMIDFFILSLERLVYKKARMPNPSRFWILFEMIIDSDRHFWLEDKRI